MHSKIVVPVPPIWTYASPAPSLVWARAIAHIDYWRTAMSRAYQGVGVITPTPNLWSNYSDTESLLTLYLNEYLINEERITITLMLSSQSLSIFWSKFIAPQSNCFVAHLDATMWHQILDIPVTEVESMVKPNGILDYFRRESMALIHFWLCHGTNTGRLTVNLSVPNCLKYF